MGLIVGNIFWILIVTGALTALVGLGALRPRQGLKDGFGGDTDDPAALLLIRHWNFLIGVTGVLLIYAAFHPEVRTLVLWVAIASKSAFAALVLAQYRTFAGKFAVTGAIGDIIMVVLFLLYLVGA
jgi:hypothetical protein